MSKNTEKPIPQSSPSSEPAKDPTQTQLVKEESGQSAEQPNGVPAAENVENTTREAEIVETESDRTKKQMEEAAKEQRLNRSTDWEEDYDEDDFYGEGDKNKEFLIPGKYKEMPGIVVVEQKRLIKVEGIEKLQAVDSQIPYQVFTTQVFENLNRKNPQGQTAFDLQGIKVRVLHQTEPKKIEKKKK